MQVMISCSPLGQRLPRLSGVFRVPAAIDLEVYSILHVLAAVPIHECAPVKELEQFIADLAAAAHSLSPPHPCFPHFLARHDTRPAVFELVRSYDTGFYLFACF